MPDRVTPDASFTVTVADVTPLPDCASVIVPLSVLPGGTAATNVSLPVVPAYVALISTDPPLTDVTMPALFTVATERFDERHSACDVTV